MWIIILNWNNASDTLACVGSVLRSDYPSFRVMVVDNGSTDDTVEVVRGHYPDVELLPLPENLGFAEGNNVGIRHAMAAGADYVLLLNNDTLVAQDTLAEIVAVGEADAATGIVGPLICYFEPADIVWNAGNMIDWRGGTHRGCHAEKPAASVGAQHYAVDYVGGCALCAKREVIERIGLLESRFFFYYEETDWCTRARSYGYQVTVAPAARIWHKVSGTIGAASPATTYYMERNQFLFYARHTRGLQRTQLMARIALRELRTIAAYSVKPRYRGRSRDRDVRLLALRDALLGRWGKMGMDVARVCHPGAA